MKKKTKITLSVLASLLIGGGIGTAIGYGIWGNNQKEAVHESSEKPVVDEGKTSDGKAQISEEAVKPAFRFGLGAEVKKALPTIGNAGNFVSHLSVSRTANVTTYNGYSFAAFDQPGDKSNDGIVVLRFSQNDFTKSDKSSFYPQSYSLIQDHMVPNDFNVGLFYKLAVAADDPGEWKYVSLTSTTVSDYASASCDNYFYIIFNVNDFNSSDFKDTICLGQYTLPSGKFTVMHYGIANGQTKDIFVDVDKNYSKDTIISSVSAKDLFGQDVPVTVTEGLDTFTPQTIGVYTLKLSATDSYGQTATATLIVHICDYAAPSVTQAKQLTFTADKGQTLKYADLSSYITVTDNGTSHGSSLTVTYTYDGAAMDTNWTKTFVAADYGTHNVKVTARDGSGNQTEKTFTLKVNDGTAPVIARRDGQEVGSTITVGLSKTFSTTLSDIIQMFQATDNVDGDVSASLAGVSDTDKNFFSNNHKVGSYTLHITAKDKDNNASTQDIPIVISADMPPVFLISDTLVYTDTNTPLTTAALAKVVTNGILAKKNVASLSVDASEYIGNEDKPGTYNITYDYTEKEETKSARRFNAVSDVKTGSFSLVVKEAADPGTKEETGGNWFTNLLRKIGEFFEKLGNWFKGVFTKFKFDCFITNAEWKLRFGEEGKTETSENEPAEKTSAGM